MKITWENVFVTKHKKSNYKIYKIKQATLFLIKRDIPEFQA